MFPASFGDVMIYDDVLKKSVSYIDSVERETRKKRIVQLTENIFKIKKFLCIMANEKEKLNKILNENPEPSKWSKWIKFIIAVLSALLGAITENSFNIF